MKIFFASLGCDKNLVDSEKMLALLEASAYEITDNESEADVIVVNTCCFIHDAKMESIEMLIEMGEWKKKGNCRVLIATGCLAQRYEEEIKTELPEVDAIIGTTAYNQIVTVIDRAFMEKEKDGEETFLSYMADLDFMPKNLTKRINSAKGFSSYLKIAEGCNKHCTYCVIPRIRGKYRSVPMEELVEEASNLAKNGTRELIIVAQETTLYGVDLYGEKTLPTLLRKLSEIQGIEWIRLLYCYPEEITEELIEEIKTNKKVCHYIDMPIQHCSDGILKDMGRRLNKKELTEKIKYIRKEIPDMVIRTTLITGFPGETKKQHEELLDFVWSMEFERLGVFSYSQEEGTPAAKRDDQIDESVKHQRYYELMEAQREIAFKKNEDMIGQRCSVIVEGFLPEDGVYVGRTYMDAPEVDGNIFFESDQEWMSGDICNVYISDAKGYDLTGIYEG